MKRAEYDWEGDFVFVVDGVRGCCLRETLEFPEEDSGGWCESDDAERENGFLRTG